MERASPSASSGRLPSFLSSLYELVSSPALDHIICWSRDGTSFVIRDSEALCTSVLPNYYKHNNLTSFCRQLNFYAFKKERINSGGDTSTSSFCHPCFLRGRADLLHKVVRKTNASAIKTMASAEATAAMAAAAATAAPGGQGFYYYMQSQPQQQYQQQSYQQLQLMQQRNQQQLSGGRSGGDATASFSHASAAGTAFLPSRNLNTGASASGRIFASPGVHRGMPHHAEAQQLPLSHHLRLALEPDSRFAAAAASSSAAAASASAAVFADTSNPFVTTAASSAPVSLPRKRGRPRKTPAPDAHTAFASAAIVTATDDSPHALDSGGDDTSASSSSHQAAHQFQSSGASVGVSSAHGARGGASRYPSARRQAGYGGGGASLLPGVTNDYSGGGPGADPFSAGMVVSAGSSAHPSSGNTSVAYYPPLSSGSPYLPDDSDDNKGVESGYVPPQQHALAPPQPLPVDGKCDSSAPIPSPPPTHPQRHRHQHLQIRPLVEGMVDAATTSAAPFPLSSVVTAAGEGLARVPAPLYGAGGGSSAHSLAGFFGTLLASPPSNIPISMVVPGYGGSSSCSSSGSGISLISAGGGGRGGGCGSSSSSSSSDVGGMDPLLSPYEGLLHLDSMGGGGGGGVGGAGSGATFCPVVSSHDATSATQQNSHTVFTFSPIRSAGGVGAGGAGSSSASTASWRARAPAADNVVGVPVEASANGDGTSSCGSDATTLTSPGVYSRSNGSSTSNNSSGDASSDGNGESVSGTSLTCGGSEQGRMVGGRVGAAATGGISSSTSEVGSSASGGSSGNSSSSSGGDSSSGGCGVKETSPSSYLNKHNHYHPQTAHAGKRPRKQ